MNIKETFKGVGETIMPNKGRGFVESFVFCFLIISIVAFNLLGIETSSIVEKAMIGMLTYMVGLNTNTGSKNE